MRAAPGRVTRERTLSVNVPAGRRGRHAHPPGRRGRGRHARRAGRRLYIFLSVKPHPFFQRDGADLYCRVPISMMTAALGGEIDGPTLDGAEVKIKIPEGAQTGKQFRLKGKGMPVLRARDTATSMSRSASRRRKT